MVRRFVFFTVGRLHVAVYRLTGGRIGGRIKKGVPVLLLTTTGRKTAKQRTAPLLYVEDGDGYAIVASAGGAPSHPAWYLNLRSDPAVTIELGGRRLEATAATAGSDDRARLWPRVTEMWPAYDGYQARTDREIPVVILTLNHR